MSYLESFMELNARGKTVNTFDAAQVRAALEREYDWSFLPQSARDVIARYSMTTVEIADMLYRYRFVDPAELLAIAEYATSLPMAELSADLLGGLGKRIENDKGVLAYRETNGVDNAVFVSIDNVVSEAHIGIEFGGHMNNVRYVIPTNFTVARDGNDSALVWNYYIMFSRYMQYCLDNNATDLHLDVVHIGKRTKYRAVCRIGPDREECTLFPLTARMNEDLIRETIKERSSNQNAVLDLDAGRGVVVTLPDVFRDGKLEIRFTAERVLGGYLCVCRLHEQKNVSLGLDDLGFDPGIVKALRDITERPSGLTIFTGKIRTGKNTTMAAVSNYIAARETKPSLMALDNPIEIVGAYPQVDYRDDIGLLRAGIRLAKKLDLDFVSLNEIPNAEVAFGVRDLVNSSIHTMTTWHMNRVWHVGYKLLEYFGGGYRDLISQMNLICNQRLYRRACPHCQKTVHREDYAPGGEHADERIYGFFVKYGLHSSSVSQGCEKCGGLGYVKGRIVVLPEIVVFTSDLVTELCRCDRPYEMEHILMEHMADSPYSLERQMCKALTDGRLSPSDTLTIV